MEGPIHNAMQDFYVLQPGSTVATSLSQSEVSRKNAWIVHVKGSQFKVSIAVPVGVFAHMLSCYHEEALNYKLKYNRAYKSLSSMDRSPQQLQLVRSIGGFPNDIKPVNIKLKSLTKHKN